MEEELSSGTVVEHEEELVAGLEGHVQAHYVRVVHGAAQHGALCLGVLHLVLLDDVVLAQHFHGVQSSVGLVPHEEHLAETPCARRETKVKNETRVGIILQ